MSSNTKIVVLRSKELIYAFIFLVLSVLILIVALSVFRKKDDNTTISSIDTTSVDADTQSLYLPGVYSSIVSLGNTHMELNVTVDHDHINSISFSGIDETVETLYPLMTPTLSELSEAILANQSTQDLTYADENRYTSMLLIQAIDEALDKARLKDAEY